MRSLNNRRSISRLAFLVLAMIAIAGVAAGQTPKPSALLDQYRAQRITWTTNIWPYANTLFGILSTIEFAWSAAVMLLRRRIFNRGHPPWFAKSCGSVPSMHCC
jgi:hypothetical protein